MEIPACRRPVVGQVVGIRQRERILNLEAMIGQDGAETVRAACQGVDEGGDQRRHIAVILLSTES
jgi:hypothetical protein